MKLKLPLILISAAGVAAASASVAMANGGQPAAQAQFFFAGADWDDDDADDRRRYGPMPRLNEAALRKVGMVSVHEVDRDDGRIDVEGRDARGREIDVEMDLKGQRVLSVDRDDDRDD